MTTESTLFFREIQRFRQPWVWIIIIITLALTLGLGGYVLFHNLIFEDFSNFNITILIVGLLPVVIGIGISALLYIMKLITEVRKDGLYIQCFPLHLQPHRISLESVKKCEVRSYRPIKEYGGWGIRYGKNGKAYNVSGNLGLQLEFTDKKRLLIGSQKPQELCDAVKSLINK